jgi:predicted SAM-dependent methyltransferase
MLNKIRYIYGKVKAKSREQLSCYIIDRYLANCSPKILQIGAGPNYKHSVYKNWLNSDIRNPISCKDGIYSIYLDLAKPFPIPSDSFDCILSQQCIEHFTFYSGIEIAKECFRILKPGGKIRVETPDIKYFIENYQKNNKPVSKEIMSFSKEYKVVDGPYNHLTALNQIFDWGHKYIYDAETLINLHYQCGFKDVHEIEMPNTNIHAFHDALLFNPGSENDPYYFESCLALEAEK